MSTPWGASQVTVSSAVAAACAWQAVSRTSRSARETGAYERMSASLRSCEGAPRGGSSSHKRCAYLTNVMRRLVGCLAMVIYFLHVVVSPNAAVHTRSPQTGPMLPAHHTEGAMRCSHTFFTPNA